MKRRILGIIIPMLVVLSLILVACAAPAAQGQAVHARQGRLHADGEDGEIPEDLKDLICINCLISNLTGNFVNDFMEYFEKKLKENKSEIIEKIIILPYPNEIYDLDF